MKTWMIYGANGYTGRLIAEEAVRRGLSPILAGRNAAEVAALADRFGLDHRVFGLDSPELVKERLQDVHLVLHCAGPFSATSGPMVAACLQTKTHYLDITGEIAVFEAIHRQDEPARNQGVVLLPGCGFDVVPTDCLAALLKQRLPDANRLVLAFTSSSRPSRGTAKTMIEGLKSGAKIRREGEIVTVPQGSLVQTIPFLSGAQPAMAIAWGDVSTAYYSTGIANIEVYLGLPASAIRRVRRMRWLRPLLATDWMQRRLKSRVERRPPGPSEEERRRARAVIYGRVENPAGESVEGHATTPNGYDLTAAASVSIVEYLLEKDVPGGATTPSLLMGADFITRLPGTSVKI